MSSRHVKGVNNGEMGFDIDLGRVGRLGIVIRLDISALESPISVRLSLRPVEGSRMPVSAPVGKQAKTSLTSQLRPTTNQKAFI